MPLRIPFAHFLIQLGSFVQSLPVVVMRSGELIEFSRQTYAKPHNVEAWSDDALVDSGLSTDELDLLAELPVKTGDLLLLGVGGGREAVPLAKMGFRVTGVDYVAELVARATENTIRRGVSMEGLVQEISQLEVPAGTYDVIWLSREMYSCVPTRVRRVRMVQRFAEALRPGGYFLCQYHLNPRTKLSRAGLFVRRLIAVCTFGNLEYEEGDLLWQNIEFIHAFKSEEEVRSELVEGGFSIIGLKMDPNSIRGGAICRRA